MKTRLLKFVVAAGSMLAIDSLSVKAQTISTFENLTLPANSYWNGSTQPMGTAFISGNAIFPNKYDTTYGASYGYWASEWAYSNKIDSTTAGFTNLLSACTKNTSPTYIVGQQNAVIRLSGNAKGKVVKGFNVTNGTYAYFSIKDGNDGNVPALVRKFGDTTGTHSGLAQGSNPDWFKLTIHKWLGGTKGTDSVTFYLADYRFADNAKDYVVKNWQWVDLESLGNVDSLQFNLSSSDMGQYGMNTPAFFCMDDFTTLDSPLSVQNMKIDNSSLALYPNPFNNFVNIDLTKLQDKNVQVNISDITGKALYSEKINSGNIISLDLSIYTNGIYFINLIGENISINKKIIKE